MSGPSGSNAMDRTVEKIQEEIRALRLSLIEVNTRMRGMGPLSYGYSDLERRHESISKQLEYLESERMALLKPPARKTRASKGPTKSQKVKDRVHELKRENSGQSTEEIIDQVAEEMGETFEATKASYYRKEKKKKPQSCEKSGATHEQRN